VAVFISFPLLLESVFLWPLDQGSRVSLVQVLFWKKNRKKKKKKRKEKRKTKRKEKKNKKKKKGKKIRTFIWEKSKEKKASSALGYIHWA
jgi:prophage tail gpP-like protein